MRPVQGRDRESNKADIDEPPLVWRELPTNLKDEPTRAQNLKLRGTRMTQLNSFALQLKNNLPERNRSLYRELKQAGRLEEYCQEKGERAARQMDSLLEKGFRDYEAQEIVTKELYEL